MIHSILTMNLDQYPTPLTDSVTCAHSSGGTFAHAGGKWVVADFARDLERKLAAAKELLALAGGYMEAHASSDDLYRWHVECEQLTGTAYPSQEGQQK